MKRPSFQFYPADWQSNANLRRCSHEEKGIWIDILCLLHDQDQYGICYWPLKEIAQAIGSTPAKIKRLVSKGVLKGSDDGKECEPLVYVPRSGRKDGPPVTLVEKQKGPIWYSSRMVEDEYKRMVRAGEIESPKPTPKDSPKGGIGATPKDSPDAHPSCARPSSSSSSSPSGKTYTSESKIPPCPVEQIIEIYKTTAKKLPSVRVIPDATKAHIRSRWQQDPKFQNLEFWQTFFEYCENNAFLSGQADGKPGEKPFRADLLWTVKASNFAKIINGNYDR